MLTILANGQKLNPLVIFQDTDTNKKLLNELGNNDYILKNKIYFKINQNAWCNGEIMKE